MRIGIIGAGPGGYEAAIAAAKSGAEVYLFEKDKVGGTCLNRGCIPTKAFWKNGEVANTLRKSSDFGFELETFRFSMEKAQNRKNEIVSRLVDGIEHLLAAYPNLHILRGNARLEKEKTIQIEHESYVCDAIIIATGAKPFRLPIRGANLPEVWTSEEALNLRELPKSLVIIGAGVIGLEFAEIFNALGVKVTVVSDFLLPPADGEIQKRIKTTFKRSGVDMQIGFLAQSIEKDGENLRIVCKKMGKEKSLELNAQNVLMATGRIPVVEDLGLENLGLDFDKQGIGVDENFETNIPGIYAIGDVVRKGIQLAHVASAQGIFVADRLTGVENKTDFSLYPACYFFYPEMAQVGETEESLKKKGKEYLAFKFQFAANGKALTLGEGEGFVKILTDTNSEEIFGVHVWGSHASDIIHEGVIAMAHHLSPKALSETIFAHPSLSETFSETVHQSIGRSVHSL